MTTPTPYTSNVWNPSVPPTFDDLKRVFGWNGQEATAFDLPEEDKKNFSEFKNADNEDKTCPQPEDPGNSQFKEKAADIIKSAGGDQQCIKTSDFFHQEASGSVRGQVKSFLGEAQAEAKFQENSTSRKATQVGCGSLLVKTTNIISKQISMQCILNNCKSNLTVDVQNGASVSIRTLKLSPEEAQQKADIIQQQNEINARTAQADNNLMANLIKSGATEYQINALSKFISDKQALLADVQKRQLETYDRQVKVTNSTVRATSDMNISAKLALSTDAQNKLSALSESISKDVAQMQVANQLGLDAQDTNVKQLVDQNSDQRSSSASSAIQNISQNTSIKSENGSHIEIEAAGIITITDSTIDSNAITNIVVQQIMTQAVTNGLDLATKALSDSKGVQETLNKVGGLDDFQKAVAESLGKGTDPGRNFGDGSSSVLMYIVGGVVLLVVLGIVANMMKSGQVPQPQSRFRALGDIAYRLRHKMGPTKPFSVEAMLGVAVVSALLVGGLFFLLKKK